MSVEAGNRYLFRWHRHGFTSDWTSHVYYRINHILISSTTSWPSNKLRLMVINAVDHCFSPPTEAVCLKIFGFNWLISEFIRIISMADDRFGLNRDFIIVFNYDYYHHVVAASFSWWLSPALLVETFVNQDSDRNAVDSLLREVAEKNDKLPRTVVLFSPLPPTELTAHHLELSLKSIWIAWTTKFIQISFKN